MRSPGRGLRRRLAAGHDRERGSAVAEFAMVSVLLLVLALSVFQLGLILYVRNSLISAASEGARSGARADAMPGEGAARTVELITSTLSGVFAEAVTSQERMAGGARVVEVTVTAPIPVIGLLGPSGSMTVVGRAFSETQVGSG
jgi:Flp pilus assembly protein TadG